MSRRLHGSLSAAVSLGVVVACTPRVPPSGWIERDSHAQSHATRDDHATATAVAKPETLDEAGLRAMLDQLGDRAPAGKLALRAARLAHHRGGDAEARAYLARAATAADEPEIHAQLVALGVELALPPVDPAVIAVLLPLTGRFSALGAELRAAIELAGVGSTRDNPKWLFVDTRGEPDGALQGVEMAFAKGAIAILGPVGEREATVAARAAMLRGIPIGLLAPADGADVSAGVFRLTESPADEARDVARMAAEDSFPTVAVFAPRDDVGRDEADAFVAEATRLGLTVTGNGTYDPTGGDLEPDVKQFLELVPAKNERLREHLARHGAKGLLTFSPDIPYSLLYIPDRYDRAALVAAFLPYYGVELRTSEFPDPVKLQRKHGGRMPQVVQLVGGAGWHHPSLPLRGGAAVQGALIVDTFAGDLGGDLAAAFSAAFQQRTGRPPSSAAAQTYDAATLVAKARLAARGASDPRSAMRGALATAKLDDGACGAATLGPDGELDRVPMILEVQGDQLIAAP